MSSIAYPDSNRNIAQNSFQCRNGDVFTVYCGDPTTTMTWLADIQQLDLSYDLDASVCLLIDIPVGFALRVVEAGELSLADLMIVVFNHCPEYSELLWDNGVSSLIDCDVMFDVLPEALACLSRGERCRYLPNHTLLLTRAERRILRLLGDGLTNEQIAHLLDMTIYSVKNSVKEIIAKLSVQNRHQAGLYFWGMLEWQVMQKYRALGNGR